MNHPEFDAYTKSPGVAIRYSAKEIAKFHLYMWEWIDYLYLLKSASDILPDPLEVETLEYAVRERFLAAGWEGTGKVALLWLPPFVFPDKLNIPTEGVVLWHVKQHEDGLSWLLSPTELPFESLGPSKTS